MTSATRVSFGLLDGVAAEAVELVNDNGLMARILPFGATLQSLMVPDREGALADIVLGYDEVQSYRDRPAWFGVTAGRYANRIAGGRFRLDGREYVLEANNGPNHLHGGSQGFDKRLWTVERAGVDEQGDAAVTLSLVSPDGDAGYPGTLRASATYTLRDGELVIEYAATCDAVTIVNLTNHAFFDLSGEGNAMRHELTLQARAFLPVDATSIPTGERRPVDGTPFDFCRPTIVGERLRDGRDEQIVIGRGYDHNFIVDGEAGTLRPAATLYDPQSGRRMTMQITAPGLQLYTGNFLDGSNAGKGGRLYRQGDALCLEPQAFPDSPNQPDFPSARLNPGDHWESKIHLRFDCIG